MTTTCKSNHSNLHQAQVEQEGPEVILSHQESKSDPEIRQKIDLPGKAVFCVKKRPSLKSGKISYNSTKSAQTYTSNDCQRRRSPRASIDCQEKEPQSQQSQEVIPGTQQTSIAASHEVIQGTKGVWTEVGHPRSAISPNPEVIRGQELAQTQRSPEVGFKFVFWL